MTPVQLRTTYLTRRHALEHSRASGRELSLFVATDELPPLKTPVTVEIAIQDSPLRFTLQCVVGFVRSNARGPNQPKGVVVIFESSTHKQQAAAMIAVCAGRPVSEGSAGSRRDDAEARCLVHAPRGVFEGIVRDISSTGAFVAGAPVKPLKEGADVELQVKPVFGSLGGQRVSARVMWVGEKYGLPGFGVRFTGQADAIRKVLVAVK